MSEPQNPNPARLPPGTSPPTKPRGIRPFVVIVPVMIVLIIAGVSAWSYWRTVTPINFPRHLVTGPRLPQKLDSSFTDSDGDLVADAPADAAMQLDPPKILFSTLDRNLDKARETWKEFFVHFKKVTGKDIELVVVPPGGLGVAEMLKEGTLHIATLSTGSVPLAVNVGGYVPMAVMADNDGKYEYQMEVLVSAGSPVKTLADLKGKKLCLTSFSSLSSFKAPIVTLWRDHRLMIGTDYDYAIIRGQEDAIKNLVEGKVEAIAVANDLLARVVARDELDTKKYRSIHKSSSYPPACFGHTHAFKPELAAKVKEAFLTFDWKGTGLDKAFGPANQHKFVPIHYKKDWEGVRTIDAAISQLAE